MLHSVRDAPGTRCIRRGDILRFGEVGRALIEVVFEIVHFHENPVRHAVVGVAAVIVGRLRVVGKMPVKGLTHAREPIWSWSPFKPAEYGSEHPGQRWLPVAQPLVLQPKLQASSSNAKKVCLSQDWPICSNRSVLSAPPLIR